MKYTKPRKHLSIRYLYFAFGLCCLLIAALANSPAPTRAALKAPLSVYDGVHEKSDCTQIAGWARDENMPDTSIYVDIYDGSTLIASVPANRFRRDFFDAGWPNPYYGFLFLTPSSLKDGKIHPIFVKFGGTNTDLSNTLQHIACNASFFPTATPAIPSSSANGDTWEQGVEFSSSMRGIIQKVRFWKADEEVGSHTARIWTASGTLLKTAPFNETSSEGWQYATVNFPITAGDRYKVTYNVNYAIAKTFNVFQNGPITKGPLTAWGSSYSKGAGTFPTTGSTSNLFVDIVFNAPR